MPEVSFHPQRKSSCLGRQDVSVQVVSSEFWEVHLPNDWVLKEHEIEHTTYVEAPDGSQGVYMSTWRDTSRPLPFAMLEARDIERRNLPDVSNRYHISSAPPNYSINPAAGGTAPATGYPDVGRTRGQLRCFQNPGRRFI